MNSEIVMYQTEDGCCKICNNCFRWKNISSLLEKSAEGTLANYYLMETSLYDADGREITENFINAEKAEQDIGFGVGTAELFLLYVWIAIVMGFGIIMTRYFLT